MVFGLLDGAGAARNGVGSPALSFGVDLVSSIPASLGHDRFFGQEQEFKMTVVGLLEFPMVRKSVCFSTHMQRGDSGKWSVYLLTVLNFGSK